VADSVESIRLAKGFFGITLLFREGYGSCWFKVSDGFC
jgi:hypothetical protein